VSQITRKESKKEISFSGKISVVKNQNIVIETRFLGLITTVAFFFFLNFLFAGGKKGSMPDAAT
jgi:hypothetical protein